MQPLGQIGGQIVPVQLPLDGLAAVGEDLHLPRDQLIELAPGEPVELAVLDHPATSPADDAEQRTVALEPHTIGQPVVHVGAQLRVVGPQ